MLAGALSGSSRVCERSAEGCAQGLKARCPADSIAFEATAAQFQAAAVRACPRARLAGEISRTGFVEAPGAAANLALVGTVSWSERSLAGYAMRCIKIVERLGETYPYAAVDQKTGEILLRLPDRATLIALCGRLGWAVHEESKSASQVCAADVQQRAAAGHTTRRHRLGGASKYTSARRRRAGRYLGGAA